MLGSPKVDSSSAEDSSKCTDPNHEKTLFQKKVLQHETARIDVVMHKTEQTFVSLSDAEWETALGPSIDYKQMKQGYLGDCYFLAALVAIAHDHKDIIRNMFTNGDLLKGDHPVYTTEWMINGRKSIVATTDELPADPASDEVYFASGKKGAFWPAILEKAWAKIFGDYKTTEGGYVVEVFKAITQAPVQVVTHDMILAGHASKHGYWQQLLEWSQNKFPMGTSTSGGKNSIGVVSGHAFAVLEAFQQEGEHPQRLKIYNPHGKDGYNGVLPNEDKGDGMFFVTFNEFLANFEKGVVAQVHTGYVVSDILLSRETESTTVLEFDMDNDEPFAVQLEWPSWRLISIKCQVADPVFTVAVAKMGSLTDYKLMTKSSVSTTNARASLPGGKGKYVVFVNARFPFTKSWLKDFVVNVYGPSVQLEKSTQYSSAMDLFLEMQGLCRTIMVPGTGKWVGQAAAEYTLDEETQVNGMPVFRGNMKDKSKQVLEAYELIVWDAAQQKTHRKGDAASFETHGSNSWQVTDTMDNAKGGVFFPTFKGLPGVQCSASLLQQDLPPGDAVPAEQVTRAAPEKPLVFDEQGRLTESDIDMAEIGTDDHNLKGDEAESCGRMVERLSELGKGSSIASSGKDPEFPASMSSIALPGTHCGDAAAGIHESCAKYNHWQSMAALKEKYAAGKSLEAQCEKDCTAKECIKKTTSPEGDCLIDFSKCSAPLKFANSDGQYYPIKTASQFSFPGSMCTDDSYKVSPS